MTNNINGTINGMSKGFGRVGMMVSSGSPGTSVTSVAGDVCYDSTNDKYYENTDGSTWSQIS